MVDTQQQSEQRRAKTLQLCLGGRAGKHKTVKNEVEEEEEAEKEEEEEEERREECVCVCPMFV